MITEVSGFEPPYSVSNNPLQITAEQAKVQLNANDDWAKSLSIMPGKIEECSLNRSSLTTLEKRIENASNLFNFNNSDGEIIKNFCQRVVEIARDKIAKDLHCEVHEVTDEQIDKFCEKISFISTVGFCGQGLDVNGSFADGLQDKVNQLISQGLFPVIITGGDNRGIGEVVKGTTRGADSSEPVPLIAILSEEGLRQIEDEHLILPKEKIIPIKNNDQEISEWCTAFSDHTELTAALIWIFGGEMVVGGGGGVGKLEMLQSLKLNNPTTYFDDFSGSGRKSSLSIAAPGTLSLTELLTTSGELHKRDNNSFDNCYENAAVKEVTNDIFRMGTITGIASFSAAPNPELGPESIATSVA